MGYSQVLVMEWLNHQVQHVAINATTIALKINSLTPFQYILN